MRTRLFVPDGYTPETPVLIVMHGASRDAERYFDDWSAAGTEHGFVVVVPEFTEADFPRSAAYNLGNVIDPDTGRPTPRESWTYSAIEPLFDDVVRRLDGRQAGYTLYGHSAGAQFVHRLLYFVPDARVTQAIAANAGWYTMPLPGMDWPYGLRGTGLDDANLDRALARPLILLLGEDDDDPAADKLRKTPEAELQGAHRLMRGQTMHRVGAAQAAGRETAFGWRVRTVPGAGHVNALMTAPAAALVR